MPSLIGQSLGRYHILEQLGEGGMATVYKAFDTRLERDVALKIIRTEQFAPAVLERILKRFEREAKALARLTHPNIIAVIDYGEHESAPYLVMPYLPGGTLKQRLGKPMPWQEAVRLLLPIAQALEYAHEHGIVHRDIKPSNILLAEKGQPMLSDFGIAKILESEETQTLTGTGVGVGTPEYMAPEQWTGQAGPRSDIYSLGVVLYELVTGRKPYVADTPAAVLLKQASEPLPRPRQYAPDLPDVVEKLLLKALAKKPEDRYPEMVGMVMALENTLAGSSQVGKSAVAQTPPKAGRVKDTQATIEQEDTYATILQEPTHDKLPLAPVRHATASFVSPPPKKRTWLPWTIGLGVVLVCAVVAILLSSSILGASLLPTRTPLPTTTPINTSTPVFTAEYSPTLANNPYLHSTSVITTDNADRVEQLAKWGRGTINKAVFSPDGGIIAAASSIGIYLYSANSFEEVRFIRSDSWIDNIAFSPDGQILASVANDGTAQFWRVSDGRLLSTLQGHTSEGIKSLAFSPNGEILAIGSYGNTIRLCSVPDGSLLRILEGHTEGVTSVAFSPDGQILASSSWDNTIRLWQVSDGTAINTLQGHTRGVTSVAFSPDGQTLASGSADYTIRLWQVSDGTVINTLQGHEDIVNSVAFSPDGQILASGSYDGTIRLWQMSDGRMLNTLTGNTTNGGWGNWYAGVVTCVTFSPDGQFLASSFGDNTLWLWKVPDGTLLNTLQGTADGVAIAISPDGQMLASGSKDGVVRLWQISDGNLLETFQGLTSSVWSLVFSPDEQILAAESSYGDAQFWRVADGSSLRNLQEPLESYISSGDIAPDMQILAWGSEKGIVRLRQASDYSLLRYFDVKSGVANVVFSPDGLTLATAASGNKVQLWQVSDGSLLHSLSLSVAGTALGLSFSRDGKYLASGDSNGHIWVWRVADGEMQVNPMEQYGYVTSLAFSSDGQILVTGSSDHMIRLWRLSDGSLLNVLRGHTGTVLSLTFTPDGKTLASGSADGTIRLWGISP